jgi:hypothetical protein
MPYISPSDYSDLVNSRNKLHDAAEKALSVLTDCCEGMSGAIDVVSIRHAKINLQHALGLKIPEVSSV